MASLVGKDINNTYQGLSAKMALSAYKKWYILLDEILRL